MIERLADPLVHLIRNADRPRPREAPRRARAAGKPSAGRIELAARHAGAAGAGHASRDDGARPRRARIRAKAEEQGLIAPGAVLVGQRAAPVHLRIPASRPPQEVSALSGRGVGMDVVKRTIEGMRGSIDIATDARRRARR